MKAFGNSMLPILKSGSTLTVYGKVVLAEYHHIIYFAFRT